MIKSQSIDVISIMRRALNTLDYRLMDHGWKVGYIIYHLLKDDPQYSKTQLVKICYTALLHDIGAYKTEDLDSLSHTNDVFDFEVKNTMEHSIYGYLFLKEYEFFNEFSDLVLFHHFTYGRLLESDCGNKELASMIFIADRMEILTKRRPNITASELFQAFENPVFNSEIVGQLKELEARDGIITKYLDDFNLTEILAFLHEVELSSEQTLTLVDMIPHTIDFRSEYTVTHTVATVKLSMMLGELCGLNEDEIMKIQVGALLHDIGKISTPLAILEKNGKLSSYEFGIMKDHVVLSDYILKGCLCEEIVHISARHHEKLDGSGYPKGLKKEDLTLSECIVAVADVLSALMGRRSYKEPFPEERVRAIMIENKEQGKLCGVVIDKALENYNMLQEGVDEVSFAAVERYYYQEREAKRLRELYQGM